VYVRRARARCGAGMTLIMGGPLVQRIITIDAKTAHEALLRNLGGKDNCGGP
jgi:hypothetical protein